MNHASFKNVILPKANIGSQVAMSEATFDGHHCLERRETLLAIDDQGRGPEA